MAHDGVWPKVLRLDTMGNPTVADVPLARSRILAAGSGGSPINLVIDHIINESEIAARVLNGP